MEFEPSYFQGEEREGFFIKPMMKRAWAAQLKTLKEIDKICKRHNIPYYAEWGTLLGAVRHQGFVPWDDDMDIGMKRADYVRFLAYAKEELPGDYKAVNIYNNPEHKELLTRVVNSHAIRTDPEFLAEFYGCPYAVGVDIFPSDYLPRRKEEEDILLTLLSVVNPLGRCWHDETITEEDKMDGIRQIEELCNIKFTQDTPIQQQLLILSDRLCAMYWDTDATEITLMPLLIQYSHYRLPVSCYASTIDVPFENTTIPIPVGYEQILTLRYGKDYMTPVREWGTHDYPFYKEQEKILFDFFQKNNMEVPDCFRE